MSRSPDRDQEEEEPLEELFGGQAFEYYRDQEEIEFSSESSEDSRSTESYQPSEVSEVGEQLAGRSQQQDQGTGPLVREPTQLQIDFPSLSLDSPPHEAETRMTTVSVGGETVRIKNAPTNAAIYSLTTLDKRERSKLSTEKRHDLFKSITSPKQQDNFALFDVSTGNATELEN